MACNCSNPTCPTFLDLQCSSYTGPTLSCIDVTMNDTLDVIIKNIDTAVCTALATGGITSFSFTNANGFTGSISNPTTTPSLTLSTTLNGYLKGNGTAMVATSSIPITDVSGFSFSFTNGNGITGNVTNATSSPVLSLGTSLTGWIKGNGTAFTAQSNITNSDLQNSTISGVSLGGNLFSLSLSSELSYDVGTTYNGSTARTLSITTAGVSNAMLQNSGYTFIIGSSGTAPNWGASSASLGGTVTLNIPLASTASVTNGGISKTNFDTFNAKIAGSGTTNYVPKFTASGTIGNSLIQDDGTNVSISGSIDASYRLSVNGQFSAQDIIDVAGITPSLRFSGAQAIEKSSTTIIIGSHASWALVDIQKNAKINTVNAGLGNGNYSTNTIFGVTAGNAFTSSGLENSFFGHSAGIVNTNGTANTFLGYFAGYTNTTSIGNTYVGWKAGRLATGGENTALGESSLEKSTGGNNTAIGATSMQNNTSGADNTAIGISSLRTNVSGIRNTALGREALGQSTGDDNLGLGYQAGYNITSGARNIIIGNNYLGNTILPNATSDKFLLGNASSFLLYGDVATEQLKIGNAGALSLTSSAIFEIASTTKGFLPPRMTTTQRDAIASPVAGLMIFNSTSSKLNFYNGSSWEAVTSA